MNESERAAKMAELQQIEATLAQLQHQSSEQERVLSIPADSEQTHYQQRIPQAPEEEYADPNTSLPADIARGIGYNAARTVTGISDLISPNSETTNRAMEMWRQDVEGSGAGGTAGNVVGELAQLAVPASLFSKGLKATGLTKALPKVAGLTTVAGDTALAAGLGYGQLPELGGQTRGDAAVGNAIASLGGGAMGGVLQKALKGANKTPAGEALMERGVPLTPAQATNNPLFQGAEYLAEMMPVLSKSVAKQKEKALEGFNRAVAQEAAPAGAKITAGGQEGMRQVKGAYKQGYKDAWEKATPFSDDTLVNLLDETKAMRKDLGPSAGYAQRKIDDAIERIDKMKDIESMENLDTVLRKQIDNAETGATPDLALSEYLQDFRTLIQERASPETSTALKELNSTYGGFMAARRATANPSALKRGKENKGIFTTDEFTNAVRGVGGEGRASTGTAPMQKTMDMGTDTMGQKMPSPLINAVKGIARSVPAPNFLLEPFARATLGDTSLQKGTNKLAEALRKSGLRGTTANTVAVEDEE